MAKSLVELLAHSRGVAGSLASARTEANAAADKYEAILRQLKANTAVVTNLRTENKALTEMVIDLKKAVEGGTPEARAQTEDKITQCRTAYAATLVELFAKAATTADVWKGQADTTAVAHSVVAKTLRLSLKEAEERVNGRRETTRVAKNAANSSSVPRTAPIVKVFSNRRATFFLHLSDAIVKAWKESVHFPTNLEGILAAAVAWLNKDKYVMSEDVLKAVVAAIRAMFTVLGLDKTFIVQGEVGVSSYVRALLGHCSVASAKVRVELIKIIRQHKQPQYKLENHRTNWLVENHRLHFFLPTHGNVQSGLLLIDGKDQNRAVVDRIVAVKPFPTWALSPDGADVTEPIGVTEPTDNGRVTVAASDAAGAAAPAGAGGSMANAVGPVPAAGRGEGTTGTGGAVASAAAAAAAAAAATAGLLPIPSEDPAAEAACAAAAAVIAAGGTSA